MKLGLASVISTFGASLKGKLANPAACGEPEEQLRAPLEALIEGIAQLCGLPPGTIQCVGESSVPP